MDERKRRRQRKWLILGVAGSLSGFVMLLLFRSVAAASDAAMSTVLAIIVMKHLALAIIAGSPLAALFQTMKPRLRAHCGRPPED